MRAGAIVVPPCTKEVTKRCLRADDAGGMHRYVVPDLLPAGRSTWQVVTKDPLHDSPSRTAAAWLSVPQRVESGASQPKVGRTRAHLLSVSMPYVVNEQHEVRVRVMRGRAVVASGRVRSPAMSTRGTFRWSRRLGGAAAPGDRLRITIVVVVGGKVVARRTNVEVVPALPVPPTMTASEARSLAREAVLIEHEFFAVRVYGCTRTSRTSFRCDVGYWVGDYSARGTLRVRNGFNAWYATFSGTYTDEHCAATGGRNCSRPERWSV